MIGGQLRREQRIGLLGGERKDDGGDEEREDGGHRDRDETPRACAGRSRLFAGERLTSAAQAGWKRRRPQRGSLLAQHGPRTLLGAHSRPAGATGDEVAVDVGAFCGRQSVIGVRGQPIDGAATLGHLRLSPWFSPYRSSPYRSSRQNRPCRQRPTAASRW